MSDTLFKNFRPLENFITFEGIEGSGKSTQIQLFKEFLEGQGKTVHHYREPGSTALGDKLRAAMLESKEPINAEAQAHIFAASRAQLMSQKVLPALKDKNVIVLIDRYIDSSIAYQGYAGELGAKRVIQLHQSEPLNYLPTLTFYLAIDYETSLSRQNIRGEHRDYFESQKKDFYLKLIDGYDRIRQDQAQRYCFIDASKSVDEIQNQMQNHWSKLHG